MMVEFYSFVKMIFLNKSYIRSRIRLKTYSFTNFHLLLFSHNFQIWKFSKKNTFESGARKIAIEKEKGTLLKTHGLWTELLLKNVKLSIETNLTAQRQFEERKKSIHKKGSPSWWIIKWLPLSQPLAFLE